MIQSKIVLTQQQRKVLNELVENNKDADPAEILNEVFKYLAPEEKQEELKEEKRREREEQRKHERRLEVIKALGTAATAASGVAIGYFQCAARTQQTKAILNDTTLSAYDKRYLVEQINPRGFWRSFVG